MTSLYESLPLDAAKEDLRLMTILPEVSFDGMLQCKMETVSLRKTTSDYDQFQSENYFAFGDDGVHEEWHRHRSHSIRGSCAPQGDDTLPKVPTHEFYRFGWGDFAALSYTWGDPAPTRAIKLNDEFVEVGLNLASALETLRRFEHFSTKFRIWIDALCINQSDGAERTREVQRMGSIYSSAWSVLGYLGPERDGSDKALELLERLSHYYGKKGECMMLRDALNKDPWCLGSGYWLALNKLTLRPYWERLWIMQEVALGGSQTVVFCGDRSINWNVFCHALEVIHVHLWKVKNIAVAADRRALDPSDSSSWEKTGPLHHIWKDLWAISQPSNRTESNLDFSRLLEVANFAQSSDPRDKLFGMLGIMPPKLAKAIVPDYAAEVNVVFLNAAKAYISAYNSLELLRDCNAWGKYGAPTWAPDWAWEGRLRDSRPAVEHMTAVDNPHYYERHESERGYQASAGFNFEGVRYTGESGRYLCCKCIVFDEVDGLGARPRGNGQHVYGTVQQPLNQGSAYGDEFDTAKALSCALYANRSQSCKDSCALLHLPTTEQDATEIFTNVVSWTEFATEGPFYNKWLYWVNANRELNVGGRAFSSYFNGIIPSDAVFEDHWTAYQSWVRTMQGRRLATTTSRRFAWVPQSSSCVTNDEVCPGDVFAIFPGCSVPILLRRVCDNDPFDTYKVLGEAYVHGFMEGEVVELKESGTYEMREVCLC